MYIRFFFWHTKKINKNEDIDCFTTFVWHCSWLFWDIWLLALWFVIAYLGFYDFWGLHISFYYCHFSFCIETLSAICIDQVVTLKKSISIACNFQPSKSSYISMPACLEVGHCCYFIDISKENCVRHILFIILRSICIILWAWTIEFILYCTMSVNKRVSSLVIFFCNNFKEQERSRRQ